MRDSWDRCIERAQQLANADDATHPLLAFYGALLGLQKVLAAGLTGNRNGAPTGALARDIELLRPGIAAFLGSISAGGPHIPPKQARRLLDGPQREIDDLLTTCWNRPSDRQFFAKAVLQPYARFLAEARAMPLDPQPTNARKHLP